MKEKIWIKITIIGIIGSVAILSGLIIAVDPFFHYHKPINMFYYKMEQKYQRYQNDGILRHFDYDAVITGTSMTENFKTSQFDELFQVHSVKVPYEGGSYKEINDSLRRALKYNEDIKIIVRGLDYAYLNDDADRMKYDSYPDYLYDDHLLNDVYYIMNKNILLDNAFRSIKLGMEMDGGITSFDDYSAWYRDYPSGKEYVLTEYERGEDAVGEPVVGLKELDAVLTKNRTNSIKRNVEQNIAELIQEYPDVTFLLFFPPYSIVEWDSYSQRGNVTQMIAAEKICIEILMQYDNVKLYSFTNNYDMITDLDNFMNSRHYGEPINEAIFTWMSQDEYLLTEDNYKQYLEDNLNFYLTYAYDDIFR